MHFPRISQNSQNSDIKCAITPLLRIRLNNFPVTKSTRAMKLQSWNYGYKGLLQHDVLDSPLRRAHTKISLALPRGGMHIEGTYPRHSSVMSELDLQETLPRKQAIDKQVFASFKRPGNQQVNSVSWISGRPIEGERSPLGEDPWEGHVLMTTQYGRQGDWRTQNNTCLVPWPTAKEQTVSAIRHPALLPGWTQACVL